MAELVGFNTLANELQKEILQLLGFQDVKSANLVCIKWFRKLSSILPPDFHLRDNKAEVLQILKESFHSTINYLQVSKYTENLPICTSTRCGIPKAKYVWLNAGNSIENTTKLLRNYAKYSYGLILYANSLEKVAPFRLKGLAYESLHYLAIVFYVPSNDLQDFGERNHLNALIQFMETTRLPNLQKINILSGTGRWSTENLLIQKFIQTVNTFFEKHEQKLTQLYYGWIPLSIVATSFRHLCNIQSLFIIFGKDDVPLPHQANEINVNLYKLTHNIQESFKHMKKLNYLDCTDIDCDSIATSQFHFEFIQSVLNENRKSIKKFYLESYDTRTDWIPINSELGLKEIELEFEDFYENTLNITPNAPRELKLVTKLGLTIKDCTSHDWTNQISLWMIVTFPNLKNLSLDISNRLKLSDIRNIICNLVQLKKLLIPGGYSAIRTEASNWLKNHTEFINSTQITDELMILINRPFPNHVFDGN